MTSMCSLYQRSYHGENYVYIIGASLSKPHTRECGAEISAWLLAKLGMYNYMYGQGLIGLGIEGMQLSQHYSNTISLGEF